MASATALFSDWIWSQPHRNYYKVRTLPDGSFDSFHDSSQSSSQYHPIRDLSEASFSARATTSPSAVPRTTGVVPYHNLYYGQSSVPLSESFGPIPTQATHTNSAASSHGFLLSSTQHHTASYRIMGKCDHPKCKDQYCIETQYEKRGFRDDLRHHEDDDKNGSMKDGDNVGGHMGFRAVRAR
ncbi:hypothetical protein BKA66DRAFT_437831 [Pyrenochaeta sp. MPI-SDFR-AT-0127]|nr:hypothetical protein BKA66DRAFT_437831 [Pyrenochaeta sp. MPI-SDFR-AT-0127]